MPGLRDSSAAVLPMAGNGLHALRKFGLSQADGALHYPAMLYDHAQDAAQSVASDGISGRSVVPVYMNQTPAPQSVAQKMVSQYGVYSSDPRELAHQALRPSMGVTAPWPAAVDTPEGVVAYRPQAVTSAISPPAMKIPQGLRVLGGNIARAAPVVAGAQALMAGTEALRNKFAGYERNARSAQLRDAYTARLQSER